MITSDQVIREFERCTGDRLRVRPTPPRLRSLSLPVVLDLRLLGRHAERELDASGEGNRLVEQYGEFAILVYPNEIQARDEYGDRSPDARGFVLGVWKR